MKVILNKPDPKFIPVTLTIVIESYDDLLAMWHRFNVGISQEYSDRFIGGDTPYKVTPRAIFTKLNDKLWEHK